MPTGTANTASVFAAFERIGADPVLARSAADVGDADRVVLPGVGTFGAAMAEIDRLEMREAITSRIEASLPTLAVCVGMQLLAEKSEESPEVAGLGVVEGRVTRFEAGTRVPQLGWNRIEPAPGASLLEPGWAYFANSYRLAAIPPGWSGATADYNGRFVSALQRGPVLACQFHPELSGSWGRQLLERWLTGGGS